MTFVPVKTDSPLMDALKEAIQGDNENARYSQRVLGEAVSTGEAKAVMQHLNDIQKVLKVMRKREQNYQTSFAQMMLNYLEDIVENIDKMNPGAVGHLKAAKEEVQKAYGLQESALKKIGLVAQLLRDKGR